MMKLSLVAVSLGVLLAGCSTRAPEPPPSPAAARPSATAHAATVTPASTTEDSVPEVAYSYNPVGRRDPFRSPLGTSCCLPPPIDCKGPLCGYSLDELKLSGVISGLSNPVAVIENPTGKAFHIHRGSQVGRNGGVVKQVLRDAIIVAEIARDSQGLPHEYETVLRVQPDLPLSLGE
jgi:type IV pilus assembly protein PilP